MNLVKFEPFGLRSFRNEFNKLFDFENELTFNSSFSLNPKSDVWETEDKVIVEIECAGLPLKDLDISVEGRNLTVKGEKKKEFEKTKNNFHLMERSYGSFYRSFSLPTFVSNDNINATYKNGVVRIEMLKKEEYKPRKIEIKELTEGSD